MCLVPIKITHHFFNYNTHKLLNQTQFHEMTTKFNFSEISNKLQHTNHTLIQKN